MPSRAGWRGWKGLDAWTYVAISLWVAIVLGVCAYAWVKPGKPSLYFLWRHTGETWLASKPLYNYEQNWFQGGFRYGPPYAVMFVLLYWLPVSLGAVVWRIGNAGFFLAALYWWLRDGAPTPFKSRQTGLFFSIAAVLSVSNLHPGQVNLLLIGLLLIALTAVQQERWNLAAFVLALTAIMKIYPLALGLLLVAVHPRKLSWRLLLMIPAVAALPFLFQYPHYVWSQYTDWIGLLSRRDELRRFLPIYSSETYRDLLQLLRLLELPITMPVYTVIQACCGLAVAAACAIARWRRTSSRVICFHVLMLGSVWMTLCGPASEPRTYGLLIPALAWWFLWTHERGCEPARFLAALALGAQLLAAFAPLSRSALYYFHSGGLMPLSALALLGSYLAGMRALRAAVSEQPDLPSVALLAA
jgi:hypothetical protein